jgi:2-polyprenyl-6-methoxyphenol hydroxylase-like FAD-dependent oxidoreductase
VLEIPVLIVGGGPVGLTASILLSHHGIRSLLVERHPGTAIHPKARGINARTMEMYRQLGIEQAIRDAGLPQDRARFIVWTRSLAGEELERRIPGRSRPENQAASPIRNALCAQDDFEPVLRKYADAAEPGELRFDTELASFEQDATGVSATLVDRSGAETRVRAQYVIAADGAQSRIRRAVGVKMLGKEHVYESVNVLLTADLRPWTEHRPSALYFVEQPGLKATFMTINGTDRWGFLVNSLSAYGLTPADFTPERTLDLIRLAVGVPDLPVTILGIVPWMASAIVAEEYRHGHVFLAGDAAHEMPPTGGFGLNTGVQDVQNLAWKLAGVLQGWAAPGVLDSYDAERRPVGRAITEQSLANSISMGRLGAGQAQGLARPEFLNEQGMIYGATYDSRAVVPDGTPAPSYANPVTDYTPSARPGGRAPHVWLARNGERVSTIDLIGKRFTVLGSGRAWREAAAALAPVPVDAFAIGDELTDPEHQWHATYGLDEGGAVLVRPDGYVAWRSRAGVADPRKALGSAFASLGLGAAAR